MGTFQHPVYSHIFITLPVIANHSSPESSLHGDLWSLANRQTIVEIIIIYQFCRTDLSLNPKGTLQSAHYDTCSQEKGKVHDSTGQKAFDAFMLCKAKLFIDLEAIYRSPMKKTKGNSTCLQQSSYIIVIHHFNLHTLQILIWTMAWFTALH